LVGGGAFSKRPLSGAQRSQCGVIAAGDGFARDGGRRLVPPAPPYPIGAPLPPANIQASIALSG
jgi:hypothetical protein